jgi:hypothetical protein
MTENIKFLNPEDWGISPVSKAQSSNHAGKVVAFIIILTLFYFFNDGTVVGFN